MLNITGDLVISQGTETLKIKTNESNQLVLTFSSWILFGTLTRLPKMVNNDIFELRKKLKHLNTPVKIEVGTGHSFILIKGRPSSLSLFTIFRIIRHVLFK
jgi:hypothetical protein